MKTKILWKFKFPSFTEVVLASNDNKLYPMLIWVLVVDLFYPFIFGISEYWRLGFIAYGVTSILRLLLWIVYLRISHKKIVWNN